MASRLLLTMLALLTSLAAQITPAQARVRAAAESEIGLTVAAVRAERISAAAVGFAFREPHRGLDRSVAPRLQAAPAWAVSPAVRIGIDRTRE